VLAAAVCVSDGGYCPTGRGGSRDGLFGGIVEVGVGRGDVVVDVGSEASVDGSDGVLIPMRAELLDWLCDDVDHDWCPLIHSCVLHASMPLKHVQVVGKDIVALSVRVEGAMAYMPLRAIGRRVITFGAYERGSQAEIVYVA